jgi:hypothetical protein
MCNATRKSTAPADLIFLVVSPPQVRGRGWRWWCSRVFSADYAHALVPVCRLRTWLWPIGLMLRLMRVKLGKKTREAYKHGSRCS